MQVDLLFDPFGAEWADLRDGAFAAEQAGFDGIWLNDHLAGAVHGASHVLECWTTLTAISALVPRVAVGPLVLNVANRDPAVVALMAATLQQVSGGRLLVGLGAGGGHGTPYATEQEALGRQVGTDATRRRAVEDAVARIRRTWTGTVAGVSGFLQPDPTPPIIIGGFGPKMAEVAGRVGDGMVTPAGPRLAELADIAREAHGRSRRDPETFVMTATGRPSARTSELLARVGVDRFIVFITALHVDGVSQARRALDQLGLTA